MIRNKFSLSNTKLFSCDTGELIPCGIQEVLPGDTFQHAVSAFVRVAPLLAPVMHPVDVTLHNWFVPTRLLWEDWEDFITGGEDGDDASVMPTITFTSPNPAVGTLADYLGLPTAVTQTVSALPFRAYALIWNEWYRDQDLQTPLTIDLASGPDTTTSTTLQNGAWAKDYFTSARPWQQKGPAVSIPIGTTAPVTGTLNNATRYVQGIGNASALSTAGTGGNENTSTGTVATLGAYASGSDLRFEMQDAGGANARPSVTVLMNGLTLTGSADLSSAAAISANALREAMALQRYMENSARYGSRYVEYIRTRFGVRPDDARLQRPEFLGGSRQRIQFSEVLQTAEGTDPVGALKGHGVAATRSNRYRKTFTEHGYVMTFFTCRPTSIYERGIARHWNRRTKEDYFQMELQAIGQQAIQNKEVYAGASSPDGTFGWQDRYDEYREAPSTVAGEFRTSLLDFWHMARIFGSEPALNADFVKCVPTERVFAVPSQDVLYVQARHRLIARRVVAKTGKSYIY